VANDPQQNAAEIGVKAQSPIALNLMIKKAGMGVKATGDLMESASQHLSENGFDLDEALNLQHSGILGMATKSLELGATMAVTVGQVGLHVLGTLIESVGDELTQGALAAGILYYHGMALASDTLALDAAHRATPAMNRSFREGVWKWVKSQGPYCEIWFASGARPLRIVVVRSSAHSPRAPMLAFKLCSVAELRLRLKPINGVEAHIGTKRI
jgi:hypothetical protein